MAQCPRCGERSAIALPTARRNARELTSGVAFLIGGAAVLVGGGYLVAGRSFNGFFVCVLGAGLAVVGAIRTIRSKYNYECPDCAYRWLGYRE